MPEDRLTVLTILRRSEQYFRKHGIESPRLDAEVLLAHTLGISRIELYTGFDRPLTPEETSACRECVRRRADREPVAYITGEKEFYSLTFAVDPRVLIPRPETEHLVDAALARLDEDGAARVLDLGTGSGAIAIALAVSREDWTFTATDLSADALTVARSNAATHGVAERIEFLEGDLFAALPEGQTFDLVVSNPPYVSAEERVDPECLREPHGAVFGHGEPLEIYGRLLEGVPAVLSKGGFVLLELPDGRAQEIAALAPESIHVEEIIRDYAGHPRVLVGCRRS
jgi:release factor glutamine methyltransferase